MSYFNNPFTISGIILVGFVLTIFCTYFIKKKEEEEETEIIEVVIAEPVINNNGENLIIYI